MAHEMLENFNRARRDAFFKKGGSAGTLPPDEKAWKLEERRFFPMPGTFVITHYADDVEYRVDGMIEKNVDKCHEYLKTLAVASSSTTGCAPMREPLCLLLLRRGLGLEDDGSAEEEAGGPAARARLRTTAGMFKKQLLDSDTDGGGGGRGARGLGLIPTLEGTHMHFVRCLKPNDYKRPLLFERSKVAGQLSSNGVVEAVKLAQAGGLPTRYSYEELWDRKGMDLGVVLRAHWRRTGRRTGGALPPAREGMKELLEGLAQGSWMSDGALLSRPDDWQPLRDGKGSYKFGRTMLFLAAGRLGQLQLLRTIELAPFAALLQSAVRRTLFVARYTIMSAKVRQVRAAVKIQRWRRRWVLLQRRMHAAQVEARRRKQAELAAAAEAEKKAAAAAAAAEEERRLQEAEAAAAAAQQEEERKRLEEERLRLEEERRRIAEAKRLEAERLAREEEERRNRWPPEGYELVDVELVRSRLADSTAPPGAPCGFGLQISREFPFVIEAMAAGGAAAVSGKVALGDKLVGVGGVSLKGVSLGDVRAKMAGKEGSSALIGLLRREGVKPPPPDVNVLQPYDTKTARRIMIRSLSILSADDGSPDRCLVKLRGLHGLQAGMFVRLSLGGVSQTEPLQGRHQIAEVAGDDAFMVKGAVPLGLEDKDLTPDLFSYPSYAVRVPAPYLLPRRAAPTGPKPRSGVEARPDRALDSAAECSTADDALVLEEFKPYKKGSKTGHRPRDIPEPLRHLGASTQEFWLRCAPARNPSDLYYRPFTWKDFERSLRQEACGRDSGLFGKFDFTDASCMPALYEALQSAAGGELPRDEAGEAVVPPRAFAAVVELASAAAPASVTDSDRERYPPWLVRHVPPVPEGGDDPVVKPQRLIEFVVAGDGSGKLELKADAAGLKLAEMAARPQVVSRSIAVLGRRGAGKSFLCRKLVEESVLTARKAQCGAESLPDLDELVPVVGPRRSGSMLGIDPDVAGCTSGITSYAARISPGDKDGRGSTSGFRMPIRVLDVEGETDSSASPQMDDGNVWPRGSMDHAARLDLQQQRRDAVLIGFPRIAFLTCDILVIVTTESLASTRLYTRLLSWAQVTSGGMCLGPKAPALVVVSNMIHCVREDADLDVAASTKKFFAVHERGVETFAPAHLFGSANKKTQQQPRLRAFFRDVSVVNIPWLPDAPPSGATAPPPLAHTQIARFQTEVYRLAVGAGGLGGLGGGNDPRRTALTERAWCDVWRCAVPLWKDAHVGISDVRSQAECLRRAPEAGLDTERDATSEVARKAMAFFDLASMAGDARRLNPCPGHQPPKRAMHLLHGIAADIAVRALAVLCRQATVANCRVDQSLALRTVLQHVGGALPCAAADPFPQGSSFDRDATACSKCRKDYEWAPYCHFRPVTKERPGAESDARRQAARRVMGGASILGQVQLYTELETQEITGGTLAVLQVVMCSNVPLPRPASGSASSDPPTEETGEPACEITTDKPHGYRAGYLVSLNIKGVEATGQVHAGPKRVLEVTGPSTFTVQGQVPKKISGEPLNAFFGRSKVWRINGSFVTDVDWTAKVSSLRVEFKDKTEALAQAGEHAAFEHELSLLMNSATSAQEEILSKCTPTYDAPGQVARLRRDALCTSLGVDPARGSASHTSL